VAVQGQQRVGQRRGGRLVPGNQQEVGVVQQLRLGDEALRQDELCNRNMCSLTNNFIDFGFTVLMDTVVANGAELDFLLGLLAPRPVRLVTLAPGVEACEQRNATRDPDERWEFDGYHRLDAEMRRDLGDIGWWFDTSVLTPAETAEQLVREAADYALLK